MPRGTIIGKAVSVALPMNCQLWSLTMTSVVVANPNFTSSVCCPVKLYDSPVEPRIAPLLGQHTDEVLSEVLGFGEKDLVDLREQNVIV